MIAFDDVAVLLRGRKYDHRETLGTVVGLHPAQHLQAIDLRQPKIEQDDLQRFHTAAAGVGALAEQEVQRFRAILDPDQLVGEIVLAQRTDA
jgi:hypothetical protein